MLVVVIPAICLVIGVVLLYICFACCEENEDEHPELDAIRATISDFRQQRRHAGPIFLPSDIETAAARFGRSTASSKKEQLLSKFKFHKVAANQRSLRAASIRAAQDVDDIDTNSPAGSDGGDEDGSVINAQLCQSFKWSLKTLLLSTWRKPSKDDSCCICLEAYRPGETICAATTPACDHVFHQECIFQWLQSDHDVCPLCRVDLMN
eukprot:scaffold158_cov105-Cylindrotheca_fusiformis.AAC.1